MLVTEIKDHAKNFPNALVFCSFTLYFLTYFFSSCAVFFPYFLNIFSISKCFSDGILFQHIQSKKKVAKIKAA